MGKYHDSKSCGFEVHVVVNELYKICFEQIKTASKFVKDWVLHLMNQKIVKYGLLTLPSLSLAEHRATGCLYGVGL